MIAIKEFSQIEKFEQRDIFYDLEVIEAFNRFCMENLEAFIKLRIKNIYISCRNNR